MVKTDNNSDKKPWWEPAVEIFTEVSSWIAGPIILALFLGKYLDGRFDTKPWIFIGLTAIAFLVSSFGIVKVVMRYMKKLEKESKETGEYKDQK